MKCSSSMKGVRNVINDYDKQKVQIIYILKRQEKVVKEKSLLVLTNCTGGDEEIENTEEKTNSDNENNSNKDSTCTSTYHIGTIVWKFFDGYGWFQGRIGKIASNAHWLEKNIKLNLRTMKRKTGCYRKYNARNRS